MTLYFENETGEDFQFDIRKLAERLIRTVCETYQCPYDIEISLILTDCEKMRRINHEFRQVNRPTDVLSFPMVNFDTPGVWNGQAVEKSADLSPETGELILGDILLCAPIVKEQAHEYGHSEYRELAFLIVHSLLHLFGFDHMEEKDRILMEQEQEHILQKCQIERR